MLRNLFFLTLFLIIPFSCDQSENLAERERKLAEKEQRFAQKEAEYQNLLQMRDSIFSRKDTLSGVKRWPENIEGRWNGKITCKESNCADYAVGDIRTDTWEFVSDSLKKSVNVYNISNQLVRTYNIQAENNAIMLRFQSDSTSAKKVEMDVVLNNFSPKRIQGTRTVTINSNCSATFSVDLTRP